VRKSITTRNRFYKEQVPSRPQFGIIFSFSLESFPLSIFSAIRPLATIIGGNYIGGIGWSCGVRSPAGERTTSAGERTPRQSPRGFFRQGTRIVGAPATTATVPTAALPTLTATTASSNTYSTTATNTTTYCTGVCSRAGI
jgi:hypothetical protein